MNCTCGFDKRTQAVNVSMIFSCQQQVLCISSVTLTGQEMTHHLFSPQLIKPLACTHLTIKQTVTSDHFICPIVSYQTHDSFRLPCFGKLTLSSFETESHFALNVIFYALSFATIVLRLECAHHQLRCFN